MLGMLGVRPVETVPDQEMIVEVETAGDGNFRTGGRSTSLSARFFVVLDDARQVETSNLERRFLPPLMSRHGERYLGFESLSPP